MLLRAICLTLILGIIAPTFGTCVTDVLAAAVVNTELSDFDGKITFDDQGFTVRQPWKYSVASPEYVMLNSSLIPASHTIAIGGSSSLLWNYWFSINPGHWMGNENWNGGSTTPGYFLAIDSTSTSYISFDPPIYQFSLRIANDVRATGTLSMYTTGGAKFNCITIPANTAITNDYRIVQVQAISDLISKIEFSAFLMAVDEIAYKVCGKGYEFSDGMCGDINECALGYCPAHSTCTNLRGSYSCTCVEGYQSDGNGTCVDVNECALNACSPDATCENLDGSFECHCLDGYTGSGIGENGCQDVNECDNTPCSDLAVCQNLNGSFACLCNKGYTGDGLGADGCQDVDECTTIPCAPQADCANTNGSYTCTCHQGYSGDGQGPDGCQDINECDQSPCAPNAQCTNNNGSFICTCPAGYDGDGIGLDGCQDVNECSSLNTPCSPLATCNNTIGDFTCTCPSGYGGDGIGENGCQENNECLVDNPCSDYANCTNIVGSYNCTCFEGFTGTGEGVDGCADIDECEFNPCGANAACQNKPGSFSCNCNDGYEGDGFNCVKLEVNTGNTPIASNKPAAPGKRGPQNSSAKIRLSSGVLLLVIVFLL